MVQQLRLYGILNEKKRELLVNSLKINLGRARIKRKEKRVSSSNVLDLFLTNNMEIR